MPQTQVEWIETEAALKELCAHLNTQAFIAIDTEFHRERTYYAELALVQVATDERVACIDPLAKENGKPLSLAPLQEVLTNPAVTKVLHAARQDLEIFYLGCGQVPAPIFDTQVAAALLGYGDQIGYGALVERVCNTPLDKLHGRTDWMRRPLDPAVIEYAAHDVTYLRDVYRALDEKLREKNRRDWLDEEQATLAAKETYDVDKDTAWHRVKGTGRLRPKEAVVAQHLARWRETLAQEKDRPRRRVLSDEAIVDLARQRPTDVNKLDRMRSLDDGTRKRFGKDLVRLVEEAMATDKSDWPASREKGRPQAKDPALAEALSTVVEVCARTHDISSKTLCNKDELDRLAAGETDLALYRGWRDRLVGGALKRFLAGDAALVVEDGQLSLEDRSA